MDRMGVATALLLAILSALSLMAGAAASADEHRRLLNGIAAPLRTLLKSTNLCTIPGSTIIDAPPPAAGAAATSDSWGAAYTSVQGYPNYGCISADGYWRTACPVTGTPPNIKPPNNFCISAVCASTAPAGNHTTHASAPEVSAPPCCPSYTVKAADTVNSIAATNGVDPLVLLIFNRLTSSLIKLNAGSIITLPCPRALAFFHALQTPAAAPVARVPKAAAKLIG